MTIQVLGTGCPTCKKLHELTVQAAKELNLNCEVEYINDIQKMLDMGVMSSPVLAIDDKPALVGQLPNIEKIKEILTASKIATPENGTGGCSCGGKC